MAVSCMRNASGYNYSNSSFIVDVVMGISIPRSTEHISNCWNFAADILQAKYDFTRKTACSNFGHFAFWAPLSKQGRIN